MDRNHNERLRVVIRGAVQGVGFRPFVYRLATEMQLTGWVINSSQGVFVEVEGAKDQLDAFLLRVAREKPPRAYIQSLESSFLDPLGFTGFEIRHSDESGPKSVLVLPDLATCPDCQREIFDPANRRYRYAFTNCTNCGPRYSIIEGLPYDRPNTSMRLFAMCPACRAEYENPLDRRFHAQPNACPVCGPHLELWDRAGCRLAQDHTALQQAAEAIRLGRIVAVKGLGGFHLMVDARNEDAVRELRRRKQREEKPFALLYPSLELASQDCEVSALEARLLLSPESPIVLLRRARLTASMPVICSSVAPAPNPWLGIMLPSSPLHHLLMAELGFPAVATSGNLSDEPICIDEREALERLGRGSVADLFLVHNRPIVRHVDDSIVRVVMGREMVMRRARGYAPLPIQCKGEALPTGSDIAATPWQCFAPTLAVGAHLKNSVAITVGANVFISQHIGDLETAQAYDAFRRVIADLSRLYEFRPAAVACDLHPDYLSTHYARDLAAHSTPPLPVIAVQHHYAHILACMADNELSGAALGVAWDGTGYGPDGSIWGGEFLLIDPAQAEGYNRIAHLRQFRLPCGDKAVKEPRRTAYGLLYELVGDAAATRADLAPIAAHPPAERAIVLQMLRQKVNAPLTSSAGRLFDACAALIGLRQRVTFEGQAAMELEFAAEQVKVDEVYPFEIRDERLEIGDWRLETGRDAAKSQISNLQSLLVDWGPMVQAVLADVQDGLPAGFISARFHNTLAEMIVAVAKIAGQQRVVLSGGVFQNVYLLQRTVKRLEAENFHPYWHQRVPPNDGGIALGQAMEAARQLSGNNNELPH